jgi:hypothetical protein
VHFDLGRDLDGDIPGVSQLSRDLEKTLIKYQHINIYY